MDQLLTKCDSQYRALQLHRNSIETMLLALQRNDKDLMPGGKASDGAAAGFALPGAVANNAANVNPAIQAVAYRYSVECKHVVQSMVQHIQKINACRKLLKAYDRRQTRTTPSVEFQSKSFVYGEPTGKTQNCCFGCATAASQYCVRMLRVIAKVKNQHYFNAYPGLVNELIETISIAGISNSDWRLNS